MSRFRLLFFFIAPVFLSSCMSYQYVTLNSELPAEPETHRYFTKENDVKISYDFFGSGMPVTSRIYNETDSGIFVDLQTSVYLLNDRVVARAAKAQKVRFKSYSTPSCILDDGTYYSEGSGTVSNQANVLYIPPGSYAEIVSRPFKVTYDKNKRMNYTEVEKRMSAGITRNIKRYDYGQDANKYGVLFRISKNSNLSEAWDMAAEFKEQSLYNFPSKPAIVPNGAAKNYYTGKNHGRDVAGGITVGVLALGIYAIIENPEVE